MGNSEKRTLSFEEGGMSISYLKPVRKDKHDENLRRSFALGKWKDNNHACVDDVIRAATNGDRNARLLLDLLLTNAWDDGWRARNG